MSEFAADLELARRILAGDDDAFTELFDANFDRLFGFAIATLGCNDDQAEELVQRTLCKALDKLGSFDGRSKLSTWLTSVMRRLYLDEVRTSSRRRAKLHLVSASEDGISRDDPAQASAELERRGMVFRVLALLPDNYSHALGQKYLYDEPLRAIAMQLGVTEKAAESTLGRARSAFRERWNDCFANPMSPEQARSR